MRIIRDLPGHSHTITHSVTARTALLILGCTCCYSTPYYTDGFAAKSTYNCSLGWCGEDWGKNRIIRYNYTEVTHMIYRTVSVMKQNLDCSHASNSLDCVDQSVASTTVQVPEIIHEWNRTTAEVEITPPDLSLGLIKTDNIDIWGKMTSLAYPRNRDKIWQISVPQPGCSMTIYFHEFDMEHTVNCKQDYFSVQTSKGQLNIPRYCNTLHRIELARTKRVQLTIHSGNYTSRKGVYAVYCFNHWPLSPTNLPCSCNGRTHNIRQRNVDMNLPVSTADMTEVDTSKLISQYLWDMFRYGETMVTAYLSEGDRLQQHLAIKFKEAIRRSG